MYLDLLIAQRKWTKYKLSKVAQIPYSTLNDLFNEKTSLIKSSGETLYKLAKAFNLSIEELINQDFLSLNPRNRLDPELFRSAIHHQIKSLGSKDFIRKILSEKSIDTYIEKKWIFEALYMTATLDYLSRLENLPIATRYDDVRNNELESIYYPISLLLLAQINKDPFLLEASFNQSIPEFKRFKIVELDLFNVV